MKTKKKTPEELSEFLHNLKEDYHHGSLAEDEVYDALLQEGYGNTKATEVLEKWSKQLFNEGLHHD